MNKLLTRQKSLWTNVSWDNSPLDNHVLWPRFSLTPITSLGQMYWLPIFAFHQQKVSQMNIENDHHRVEVYTWLFRSKPFLKNQITIFQALSVWLVIYIPQNIVGTVWPLCTIPGHRGLSWKMVDLCTSNGIFDRPCKTNLRELSLQNRPSSVPWWFDLVWNKFFSLFPPESSDVEFPRGVLPKPR